MNPERIQVTALSEQELFALYWLQYFIVPINEYALQRLWRLRPEADPKAKETLRIERIVDAGFVRRRSSRYTFELAFVRSAFTADEFRFILESVEKHNWRFKVDVLTYQWASHAFPESSLRELSVSRRYPTDGREALFILRQMHVLFRWGLPMLEAMEQCRDDRFYRGGPDIYGSDFGDEANDQVRIRAALTRCGMNCVFDSFGRASLVNDEEGAVAVYNRRVVPFGSSRPMIALAQRLVETLKRNQAVCGMTEEALLLAVVATLEFRCGDDVGWCLSRLELLFPRIPFAVQISDLILTLAFWRGDRELIGRHAELVQKMRRSDEYAQVLLLMLDGNVDLAAKRLSSAIGLADMTSEHDIFCLPSLLTWLVIWSKAKNNRTAIKRISRYIENVYETYCADDSVTSSERRWIHLHVQLALDTFPKVGANAFAETTFNGISSLLRTALALSGAETMFAHSSRNGEKELAVAARALNAGYLTVAADAVAEIRDAPNLVSVADQATELADKIAACDGAPALGPRQYVAPWEKALDAIETRMLGTRKGSAEAITQGRIVWCWHVYSAKTEQSVDMIGAVYVGVKRDGGEKVPVRISEARLLDGTYDRVMTDEDLRIRTELARRNVLREKPSQTHESPTFDALRLFEGVKELRIYETTIRKSPYIEKAKPARLAFGTVRASVTADENGGVSISRDPCHSVHSKRGYVILRDEGDHDLWHVKSVSSSYREIVSVLNDLSPNGTLVIPRDGLPRVTKLMTQLGRTAPIAWRRQAEGAAADVKRVPAETRACVRLRSDGDSLTVHLVVRLSHDPDWTSEPGAGMPELTVVRADGGREMIVRDFAAETAASDAVRQVMTAFTAAEGPADHWSFYGVEESLDALSRLYAASKGETFDLEWPNGNRLDLANVVSHSAHFSDGETADYWLSVQGEFKLDDGKVLSFADLLRNFDSREGSYIRLTESRYLKLSAAMARRIEALKGAGFERGGAFVISPAALPSLEKTSREAEADEFLPLPQIVAERLGRIRAVFAETPRAPRAFKGTMRPYQEEGYRWLSRLSDCGIGCCLADDMGLGKTIQLIALLAAKKSEGPSLVIAPASVAFNWRNELERFAPSLRAALVGQAGEGNEEEVAKLAKKSDVVVTSYGVAASRLASFAAVAWNVLVLDEAQAIKNHLTQRAKSVRELKARFRVAATGTPVENRLSELWSIFDFLNPGMLGGEVRFAKELAPHGEASPRLKRLVKPLLLRRIKRDVLTDLPEKEEITVPVVLGDEERHAYEATRLSALARLEEGDRRNKIAILAALTRLRRFCCHPSLVMPSVQVGAKLEALERLLAGLKENGHRALVFSQFVDFLSIVRAMFEKNGWTYQYLDGATPKAEREASVEAFQDGEGDFFLISLKAGGMGLNLTAANYVILLDPWWNPAVENQAADRVHRIGQRLPVTVYRLIAQDTIEEKVVNLHAKKTALAEDILALGAASLSAEAMLGLLAE